MHLPWVAQEDDRAHPGRGDYRRVPWIGLLILLGWLFPAAVLAAGFVQMRVLSTPVVTSLSPTQVGAGSQVVLRLQGYALRNGLVGNFGQGIQTDPTSDSAAGGRGVQMRIRVAPDAPLGRHELILVVGDQRLPQRVYVTVEAAPHLSVSHLPPLHIERKSPPATTGIAPPVSILSEAIPATVHAGSRLRLTLEGRELMRGLHVDYGRGVHVVSLDVLSATRATAVVKIDSTARPGRRLPRATEPNARVRVLPRAAIQILPSIVHITPGIHAIEKRPKKPGFVGFAPRVYPRVLDITPNRLEPGKDYHVTAHGADLTDQLELRLGNGVHIDSIQILDSHRASVSLHIDAKAGPGTRQVQARAGSRGLWAQQPAAIRVERPFRIVRLPEPKLPKVDWKATIEGTILLEGPKWFSGYASVAHKDPLTGKVYGTDVVRTDVHVPTIKDDDVFTWREQNPGMAQWFEVRFYHGNKLIAERRVEASKVGHSDKKVLPTWLTPDPQLIMTLAQVLPAPNMHARAMEHGYAYNSTGTVSDEALGWKNKNALPPSDITWEVVGYRRYFQSGVAPKVAWQMRRPVLLASVGGSGALALVGGFSPEPSSLGRMVPREVERSKRWPLNLPARPTGLGCGSQAPSNLDVIPIDKKANATSVHTGERWELTGALDLNHSPWSSHPQTSQPVKGSGNKVLSTTWRFDNVYIDWGDGAVAPLAVSQSGDHGDYQANDSIDLSRVIGHYRHAYAQTGSYTVRVYQLAEGDIQHESAGNVSATVNHNGSLYATAMRYGTGSSHNDEATPRYFAHAKAVGDRAYMLMCRTVEIKPRHDAASDGPLTLVAAKLRGFPEAPGDDTPPTGVSVAPPAAESSPFGSLHVGSGGSATGAGSIKVETSHAQASFSSHEIAQIFHTGAGGEPSFSACDVALTGGGYTYYYGQGSVRWTWYVDGQSVGTQTVALGPSTPRSDEVLAGKDPGSPLISASELQPSPRISLKTLGEHRLSFDVQVVYDASGLRHLSEVLGDALGAGGRKPNRRLAGQLVAGMHGAPPVGVLPPQGVTVPPGTDPVAWLNRPLQRIARARRRPLLLAALSGPGYGGGEIAIGQALDAASSSLPKRGPPSYVASNALDYKVVGYDDSKPCMFKFPVKGGGEFTIGGLQGTGADGKTTTTTVHHHGNLWSGTGLLFVTLPGGSSQWPVPLKFKDWSLKPDGATVASGSFDLANPIESTLSVAGAKIKVQRLRGKAGDSVLMTLHARIDNPNILESANQKAPPPLVATSVLSPQGDWYAEGLSLPKLDVYDSGFTLTPKSVALDLSLSKGIGCNGGGHGWMGFAFGKGSRLSAYTFELKKAQHGAASGWGIDGSGLCGKTSFASYTSPIERGSIHWDGIDADASGGTFTAIYHGLRVHVPWLDTDLGGGDQKLQAGKGSGGGTLSLNLSGNAPARQFGPVTLEAKGLEFSALKGVGPAVHAGTTLFSFKADGRLFAKDIAVPNLYFGMNGKAYFDGNGGSAHVSLSGTKGRLSEGVVDLKGLDVVATPGQSSRLLFNFSTELRISDALPAAPAPVSYHIDEPSAQKYTGYGPATGHFVIHKAFPDANPSTDTVIRPVYAGSHNGATAMSGGGPLDWLVPRAYAAQSHMTYCGDVDLGMFGGPPVKGGFALGYEGSDDFWAAHADVSLGPTGMPLVPPFMQLYVIGGGLGYNVAIDSFASDKSCDVHPMIDHTPVFNAHVVVGDPGHEVYGFDGELSVKVSGPEAGARMDYKAWLARDRSQWKGPGDFHGRFQYANGNFDGTLNGHYGFLDDKVYIDAAHDAVAMHFGGGRWYIHAGTHDNPVKGHVLLIDGAAWMGLGSDGTYAGAKAHLSLGGGNCDAACAQVHANTALEAKIGFKPVHIDANAHMHMDAHACAFDICLGAGVGTHMHLAALPPELAVGFELGGCPPGHLDVNLRILPSPKPSIGGGLCAW